MAENIGEENKGISNVSNSQSMSTIEIYISYVKDNFFKLKLLLFIIYIILFYFE